MKCWDTFRCVRLFPAHGFAVLRCQLQDIDWLINRALVYGALTGALVYIGNVVIFQGLLGTLAAGAARTLAVFGREARDETNLDRLAGELVGVAHETIQPAQASLWLKPPLGPSRASPPDCVCS